MNVIYLSNLMKALTGTTIGTKHCADVFVRNDGSNPIFVSGVSGLDTKETRLHDITATNINANTGAFVEVGGLSAVSIANAIQALQVSYTAGEPLEFRTGASALAAAANSNKFVLNQGDGPVNLDIAFAIGNKLWVRSATANAVDSGYITINFMGA